MLTKSMTKNTLINTIEASLIGVTEKILYIDTIEIFLPEEAPRFILRKARQINYEKLISRKGKHGGFILSVHQPTLSCITFLATEFPEHHVCRIDCALDLLSQTSSRAVEMQRVLQHFVIMPWRGRRVSHTHHITLYLSSAWHGRNIIIYSDRPSKIRREPTCHMEFRWYGAQMCQSIGIRSLNDFSIFNPLPAMERHSRLGKLNWVLFKRSFVEYAGQRMLKAKHYPGFRRNRAQVSARICGHLSRIFQRSDEIASFENLQDRVSVQNWIDLGSDWPHVRLALGRSLVKISSSILFSGAQLCSFPERRA